MTRINQEIVRELSNIIRNELKDPRIAMMTSVTGADAGTDLKTCKVYISAYGEEDAMERTMEGLQKAEGFIRRQLAMNLNLRNTPALTFIPDRSMEYGMHIDGLLKELLPDGASDADGEEDAEENA